MAFMTIISTFRKITSVCFLSFCIPSLSSAQTHPVKISILQFVEHPALNATREGLREELFSLGYKEGDNLVTDFQCAQGNPALASQIAQKFVSNKSDLIVAISTAAAQTALAATKEFKTPIVFSSVTDPVSAKLVANLNNPSDNITGVSNFIAIKPQFSFFKKLLPSLKTLGVIYNPGEENSTTLKGLMEASAKEFGWDLITVPAPKSSDVFAATQSLCGKVDAIFINNDNTALSAFKSVVKAAQECKIPVFVSDVDVAAQGAFAAMGPNQKDIGRQTARIADFILNHPGHPLPPVEFPQKVTEFVTNSQ